MLYSVSWFDGEKHNRLNLCSLDRIDLKLNV